jgi:outer membrane protein assembly factor BamB
VVNDLVFTTTFEGVLWALNADSGEVVWQANLPTPTSNTPVAVAGDTLLTGTPQEIVAYRLSGDE